MLCLGDFINTFIYMNCYSKQTLDCDSRLVHLPIGVEPLQLRLVDLSKGWGQVQVFQHQARKKQYTC